MTTRAAARDAAALDAALLAAIHAAKAGDPLSPVTVVSPSHPASVLLRRTMPLAGSPGERRGLANVQWSTLRALIESLGTPVLRRQGLQLAAPVIEREALRSTLAESRGWWPQVAGHRRTVAAVERAFSELRRLSPGALETLARAPERGHEVTQLLVAVRARLHEHGYADELDLRDCALEAARGRDPGFDPGALVVIDPGPIGPGEQAVLDALCRRWPSRAVGDGGGEPATDVFECADPAEEARLAVRLVVGAMEEGAPLWRQALLVPPGAGYELVLHQQLDAAGIPFHGPARRHVDRSGPGRALLGLFDLLAAGDLPRGEVMAWLACAPLRTGTGGRPVPVSRWNALSAEAGVVRGASQWRERLERLALREPAESDEALALADFVDDLAGRGEARGRSWGARSDWALGLVDHYLDPETGPPWPDEERLALDQVRAALTELAGLDAVSGQVDATTFRRAVCAELERRALEESELHGGVGHGVLVGPFSSARGLHFEVTVLVGMADALVPGRGGDDPLLPDEFRRLDPSGALRARPARQRELEAEMAAALHSGTGRRVLVRPRADPRSGRAHTPSRWTAALCGSGTRRETVASFAASLRSDGPALGRSEHVLRSLDAWQAVTGDQARCPALDADTRLATGFEAIRSRRSRAFTRFDGFVGPGAVSPFDPDRPVSATRLETYAECPRRFLFSRVLGIEERALPEDLWRIEARDRGSLVHAVLERYVLERIAGAPRSMVRLLEIGEELLDEVAAGGRVGKALLWRVDRAAITRDLQTFFAEEVGLVPLAAEFAFGTDESDAAPPVPVTLTSGRTVRFRGRADRVDRADDGRLVVSDYKTGRQSGLARLTGDPLAGGRRLQLPLYALAARREFGDGRDPVEARYWMVSAERVAAFYRLELDDDLERHFVDMVGRMARGIDEGLFPAIPGPPRDHGFEVCLWCDFDRVCSATRDRQWASKRGAPELDAVNDLVDAQVPDTLAGAVVRQAASPQAPA